MFSAIAGIVGFILVAAALIVFGFIALAVLKIVGIIAVTGAAQGAANEPAKFLKAVLLILIVGVGLLVYAILKIT
jgi:glucose uptake protein GlcU